MLGNKEIMAKNIQYYMSKHNKTRSEMCEALGVKYTTFTDWVKGNTYPRIDKIELMANYFGINKSDLVEQREPSLHESLPKKLSSDEELLLEHYSKLNKPGKENLLEYAEMLTYNPKYKKESLKEA